MKPLFALLVVLFSSCARGKTTEYTGSTPAGEIVRAFFGIALTDSIDFMRWNLRIEEKAYQLTCHYGIGKANTNGFVDGGKEINVNGRLEKKAHQFSLDYKGKRLQLAALNNNLLHVLDGKGNLLVGNAGWSYTLSNTQPSNDNDVNLAGKQTALKDSMAFQGRTPCLAFENGKNQDCYKLKWWIVLYADPTDRKPAGYYLNGTAVDHKGIKGQWSILKGHNTRIIYQLTSQEGNKLYLLKLDENILVFTDKAGNLLTGNEDFSFTLNRKR